MNMADAGVMCLVIIDVVVIASIAIGLGMLLFTKEQPSKRETKCNNCDKCKCKVNQK